MEEKSRNIVVLASGTGSSLQAIIDAIENKVLNAKVVAIISNKKDSGALNIAIQHHIPSICFVYKSDEQTREKYDEYLAKGVKKFNPDLVVLAGWMRILTKEFISQFPNLINLHPALPGIFPGDTAVKDALEAFRRKEVTKTGSMIHHVVEEVDAGKVINKVEVPIYDFDSLQTLQTRIQYFEKPLLLQAIQVTLDEINNNLSESQPESEAPKYPFRGKVRDIYESSYNPNHLCVVHSNRLSAFDRHICDVPKKGTVLNLLSKYWFLKTRHIVPNHYLYGKNNTMIVKKCTPFPVEVVVRGYITGNTKTSLWTHYNNGEREYCGLYFPDGLKKNQKIKTVITPTTKGEVDEPISHEDIIERGLMTKEEWHYVSNAALALFKYGQDHAEKRGFLLVDTKYEFGKDNEGNILLIDELHTCDSSRFWVSKSYKERFIMNQEPEKLDKDCIRDYIKSQPDLDPYEENPQVEFKFPRENNGLIEEEDYHQILRVSETYEEFYKDLTLKNTNPILYEDIDYSRICNTYDENFEPTAVIVAGSVSDKEHVTKLEKELQSQNVATKTYYASAHKSTKEVLKIIKEYDNKPKKVVWVTVAGRSNALSGVVAANSVNPVIGCPPFKDKMDMMVNINSTLQCPSKVPVLTILEPNNVAISIKRIFSL